MHAIETESLTKKFGQLTAVDSVSLKVRKGEIFGLLGPNGAGKTTLISMLVTMKRPTSGRALVNGFDVGKEPGETRKNVGIVFQDPSLDEELTAYENLELHGAMYGIDAEDRKKRINELVETVELKDRLHDQVKTYSGGMRRRLEIARGLMHYPKLLFLDEPTLGLDLQTRRHVWDYIRKLKAEHDVTIILTTHYLEEADSTCDRIAIIDHGRIIALDTPEALKNSLGGDVIVVTTADAPALASALKGLDWVKSAKSDDGSLTLTVRNGEKRMVDLFDVANRNGVRLDSVRLHKPTLDDVFLQYTGRSIREEQASPKDAMRMRRKAWGRR
jgi:ABC-2 type transport system ATP-binding protein